MKYRVLATVAAAAAIAFAQPVAYLAQEGSKAAEILGLARKAIGGARLDALKTFSVESAVERNIATMQINSDVEVLVELPDKYARIESASGGGGMVMAGGGTTGFNGDRPLQKIGAGGAPGGVMVFRMGGGAGPVPGGGPGEKLTPEQRDQMSASMVRSSRTEISRLMLGWFAMAHPAVQAAYTYLGEAESVDGKAYVLEVKNADGFAARLFVDEQTHLPLMVTYKASQPRVITQTMGDPPPAPAAGSGAHAVTQAQPIAGEQDKTKADFDKQVQDAQRQPSATIDYTLYFEEWRDADGVKFPFKIRRAAAGATSEEWTISKVRINPKIDAKKFAVDGGS